MTITNKTYNTLIDKRLLPPLLRQRVNILIWFFLVSACHAWVIPVLAGFFVSGRAELW